MTGSMILDILSNNIKGKQIDEEATSLFTTTYNEYIPAPILNPTQLRTVKPLVRKHSVDPLTGEIPKEVVDAGSVKKHEPAFVNRQAVAKQTIVLTNVNVVTQKKEVRKMLGITEKNIMMMRYENMTFKMPAITKEQGFARKLFHEHRDTLMCYLTLVDVATCDKVLAELDGRTEPLVLHGKNCFYTRETEKNFDEKKSVFVGNLPMEVTEQDLYDFFSKAGTVKNVRALRDAQSGIGRGIAYVLFDTSSAVGLALAMKDHVFHYKFENPDKKDIHFRKLRIDRMTPSARSYNNSKTPVINFKPHSACEPITNEEKVQAKREKKRKSMEKKALPTGNKDRHRNRPDADIKLKIKKPSKVIFGEEEGAKDVKIVLPRNTKVKKQERGRRVFNK